MNNFEMEEKCSHPIESNGMCGVCGEDLKANRAGMRTSVTQHNHPANATTSMMHHHKHHHLGHASVSLVHTDPSLLVSEKLALELGKKDLINLVNNRKLVLLVDLDHTLIHTTNENVDPNLKDVFHYELNPKNVWYHTKFRPGCKHFIEEMSKIYELHMVTFGENSYAHKIATLMDPDRKFFHDRILSRNEIFNPHSKADNLKSLFPCGDLMVCIIDDREDVWNYARNLVCVQPYVFFKNTGDINEPSTLIKRKIKRPRLNEQDPTTTTINATNTTNKINNTTNNNSADIATTDENSNSATTTSAKAPLVDETAGVDSSAVGDIGSVMGVLDLQQGNSASSTRLHDPDDYLGYLERILRNIHDEYYRIYETRMLTTHGQTGKTNDVNETDLPDVKKILPMIKSRVLENCVITFSGVVPTGYDLKKQRCYLMATSLGAKVNEELSLAESIVDSDLEAFEAMFTTVTNATITTTTIESVATMTTTTTTTTTTASQKRHKKYEYKFDEEQSSSDSSGACANKSDDSSELSSNEESEEEKQQRRNKRVTTHLVAAKYGTTKVYDALKSSTSIKVVTPEWLINCNFKWTKCDEEEFKLTKEYEYKNCIFHHEYNLH